jgi:flagellin-like hook-associated protein FlgL
MSSKDITLSSGVRQNLLSLQTIATLTATTQNRLASGKKVNTALDNAVNYFTSAGLQSRATDLGALLDAMSSAIQTVVAANNGIEAITTTIQSMQATLMQARQDASWQSTSYAYSITATAGAALTFVNGSVGTTAITVSLDTGASLPMTVDQAVQAINGTGALVGHVKAWNDAGQLRIQNISTAVLDITGANAGSISDANAALTDSIAANTVRLNLVTQYNLLRDQLDKFAADASFNGVNLLQGDVLKVVFNEMSTSTLDIQALDVNGNPFVVNSANLGINSLVNANLDSNTNIDTMLNGLRTSLLNARSLASNFGSNLSVVQNRQDFTKNMITTLKTGADNLVIADTNEEGANMLALQTRQQLSITALSLANQSNQSVLRLFGG